MPWLAEFNAEKFVLFTLVLTRISGLTMTAPIFGTRDVPAQVRVFLSVALALLVLPGQWNATLAAPQGLLGYLLLVGGELVVGLSLGLGVIVIFSGAQLAGEMVANVGGLSAADVLDPASETSVPVFSRFTQYVALAVFVCIGGHRMVMAGLLETYRILPLGGITWCPSLAEAFVALVSESFHLAVRAAAPIVVSLLLATLVLGLIGRTLPQLNVMILGFNLNSMLTFTALALTLGSAAWLFQDPVAEAVRDLIEAMRGAGAVALSGG